MDTTHLISASITPVVLISACGLITLALYNRLGAILARIRAFHQQKISLIDDIRDHDQGEEPILLNMLDAQIAAVTLKARVIQKGLYCLLSAVAAFLLCSPLAAAAAWQPWIGFAALGMQFVGIGMFLAGIGWSIRELTLSLSPLEEESAYLEAVTESHLEQGRGAFARKLQGQGRQRVAI